MRLTRPVSIERLYADHRRMRFIYGAAIIIVTVVTTYIYTASSTPRFTLPSPFQPIAGQPIPANSTGQ